MSMYGKVKITVHRGTHQIGGCCTEIEYLSTRILIDIGQPLPGYEQNKLQIEGVTKGNAKCDGIFLTHYHGDHIGELSNVVLQIPIYASSCTKEFIKAYKERIGRNYVCAAGRIEGVVKKGKTWLIPSDAVKPADGRYKHSADIKEG